MTGLKSASDRKLPARRVLATWLVVTLAAVFLSLAMGDRIRRTVFDGWQLLGPRDVSATDVRVVMIDDRSIETVGPWPWPRYYMARLTEELAARGAKVIAFDIMFPEYDRVRPETFVSLYPELSESAAAEVKALEPMDQLFGKVIGASPVVLAHAGVEEIAEGQAPIGDAPISGAVAPNLDSWPAELAAIPELDDVAMGHGLINVRPDSDGVIRSLPMIISVNGKPRPGFALEIARNTLDAGSVSSSPARVRVGDRAIPVDRRGRVFLHFGGFPASRIISAADVLGGSKRLGANLFAGKPVIVGVSHEGNSDIAASPLASEEFGPLIQAQMVDSILRGGWLERPPWAGPAEWAVAALLAFLALGIAIFGGAYRAVFAFAFLSLPFISWFAFSGRSLLIDPARPLLVAGGAVAGVGIALFALARIERERLRDALVQERVSTAETQGELQAARAIQLGMVPTRERLRSLDPRLDLDALLEPAKSIGGDYYDAMKIGDDLIGFAIADVTGKGVPAALFMAMSKALTSAALSRMNADPAAIAAAINAELLKENSEALGVAILLGVLNLQTGEVQMVSAGHEDPMLMPVDGKAQRIRLEGGPPLCVTDFSYPLESMTLRPGESLVLVTDGVTEAQDPQGSFFGRDWMARLSGLKDIGASAVVDAIRDQVRAFEGGAEPTDDLTVMVLHYLGPR